MNKNVNRGAWVGQHADVKGMLVAAQGTDTAENIAGYVEDRTEKEVHKIKWK